MITRRGFFGGLVGVIAAGFTLPVWLRRRKPGPRWDGTSGSRIKDGDQRIDGWTYEKTGGGQEIVTICLAGETIGHSHVLAPGDRLKVT